MVKNIYGSFVQIKIPDGIDAIEDLRNHHPKSVSAVFMAFIKMIDKSSCLICTQSQMAIECGISLMTARRAMALLKEKKYINVRKIAVGLFVEINSRIAVKTNERKLLTRGGHELWEAKIMMTPRK